MTTTPDNTFDIGPTPPPWALPGAQPNWDSLTADGATVLGWTRDVGDLVWIACDDTIVNGEWVRARSAIGFCEPSADGLDSTGARRLAAELRNDAAVLDESAS